MNNLLHSILQRRRPAKSKTESSFVSELIDTLPNVKQDKFGNRILITGESKTIISVHTDTVHGQEGTQEIIESNAGIVSLHPVPLRNESRSKSKRKRKRMNYINNCLGADDGAGIYAALRMIQARVKATYIFHREEEIGGNGSTAFAWNHPAFLEGYDRCIALDRRGSKDIIEYQLGSRCCSKEFAASFGILLGMKHKPARGSFTDSANYTDLIPECTNLSIGYACEHTELESLNTVYLETIIDKLCTVDLESLPTVRVAGEMEFEPREKSPYTFPHYWEIELDRKDAMERELDRQLEIDLAKDYYDPDDSDTPLDPYRWHGIRKGER